VSVNPCAQLRYVRVSREITVLPSVSLHESVAPSYSRSGELVLSLNISNYRTDGTPEEREVTVHKVGPVGGLPRGEGGNDGLIA
jgi:hypothetical protein